MAATPGLSLPSMKRDRSRWRGRYAFLLPRIITPHPEEQTARAASRRMGHFKLIGRQAARTHLAPPARHAAINKQA